MSEYSYTGDISMTLRKLTIANGATVSDIVDVQGHGLVGIIIPAAFTGTTLTFQGSFDNNTFVAMYDSAGTELSVTVSTSRMISFCPSDFVSPRYLKIVSGSAEGAERIVELMFRGFK